MPDHETFSQKLSFKDNGDREDIDSVSSTISSTIGAVYNCGYDCVRFQPLTRISYDSLTSEERQAMKEDYFKAYDLMTGLRTAASLGGTILLFSLFILYKMKCRRGKKKKKTPLTTVTLDGTPMAETHRPIEIPNMTRGDAVQGSETTITPPGHSGKSRFSCDIIPCHGSMQISADYSQSSCTCIALQGEPQKGAQLSRTPTPFSVHTNLAYQMSQTTEAEKLLRPAILPTAAPINILIIHPTPTVSPCGSIRRLSEGGSKVKRQKDLQLQSACSAPPVNLPVIHRPLQPVSNSHVRCEQSAPDAEKFSHSSSSASTVTPRHSKQEKIQFIDCVESDAVSVNGLENDESALSATGNNDCLHATHHPLLQSKNLRQADTNNCSISKGASDNSCISETQC